MHEELAGYLNTLDSDDCYRVDAVLKEGPHEITERVFLIDANGEERGPFIRKRFNAEMNLGTAYSRIYEAQNNGARFLHLPRIFECADNGDGLTVIMEWIDGETIADRISRTGGSINYVRTMFPLICDAVSELHEKFDPPLIHRDLTPSNIIVSPDNLTLVDFGIARTFKESADQDTTCFGTRSYAPPEQFGYGQTSTQSDVYALGMLLYYCLTGEAPSPNTLKERLESGILPVELANIIPKATAFDPQARYASVPALKTALVDTLGGSIGASIQCATTEQEGSHQDDQQNGQPSNRPKQRGKAANNTPQRKRRFRVPRWIGVTWNVLLIASWVIITMGSLTATFAPSEEIARYPLLLRFIIYFLAFILGGAFASYAFMDKRRIRARHGSFPWIDWKLETLVCLGIAFVLFFLMVVLLGIASSIY